MTAYNKFFFGNGFPPAKKHQKFISSIYYKGYYRPIINPDRSLLQWEIYYTVPNDQITTRVHANLHRRGWGRGPAGCGMVSKTKYSCFPWPVSRQERFQRVYKCFTTKIHASKPQNAWLLKGISMLPL